MTHFDIQTDPSLKWSGQIHKLTFFNHKHMFQQQNFIGDPNMAIACQVQNRVSENEINF